MPIECARFEQKPEYSIKNDNYKGRRMAGEVADGSSPSSW